jgi:hypothetical protein
VTNPSGELTFGQIPDAVLAQFPQTALTYEKVRLRHKGEEDEPWFVYAVVYDVLGRYLDSVLSDLDEEVEVRRVMEFVERLAGHRDMRIRGLVATEIAYPLFGPGRQELLQRARLFAGPATRERVNEQERLVASARPGLAQRITLALLGLRKVRVRHRGQRR